MLVQIGNRALLFATLILLVLACGSCAGPSQTVPILTEGDFLARIQTQVSKGGISVSAAVPSAKESEALFGISLYKRGIQPVWLEISNDTNRGVSFLPVGLGHVRTDCGRLQDDAADYSHSVEATRLQQRGGEKVQYSRSVAH